MNRPPINAKRVLIFLTVLLLIASQLPVGAGNHNLLPATILYRSHLHAGLAIDTDLHYTPPAAR